MIARRARLVLAIAVVVVLASGAGYIATHQISANFVGSSMERAVPNPVLDVHEGHAFEKAYLRQHFPDAEFAGHATVEGKRPDTMYSMWELRVAGRKRELWFDVTPSFRELTKDM